MTKKVDDEDGDVKPIRLRMLMDKKTSQKGRRMRRRRRSRRDSTPRLLRERAVRKKNARDMGESNRSRRKLGESFTDSSEALIRSEEPMTNEKEADADVVNVNVNADSRKAYITQLVAPSIRVQLTSGHLRDP